MTNEEKAKELRKIALPNPLPDGYGMWLCSSDVDEVLIKMAEWKEQQFQEEKKQLIEKTAKWLDDNQQVYREYDESGFYHEKSQHLIKDFKQVMEEQL